MIRSTFYVLISTILCVLSFTRVQSQSTDSLNAEQLTRAVQAWQQGHPAIAYGALDSISAVATTSSNASVKIKAAIWTATYLEEQKKLKPALHFIDSAFTWANTFSKGDELAKVYEAYAQWHLLNGNARSAMSAQTEAMRLRDSIHQQVLIIERDSLKAVIDSQHQAAQQDSVTVQHEEVNAASSTNQNKYLLWILGAVIAVLLIIVIRMNGMLQRMKGLPPAPVKSAPRVMEPATVTAVSEPKTVKPAPVQTESAPALPPSVPVTGGGKDLTSRLSEVELVLIRAETLGRYSNGEWKSVKNLLNEYLTQLPLILKNLDDAIAKNETAPILQGLEYLRPYLQAFGMLSTLSLIREIEEEANEAKASKLLSRVFQIRNHTRRAADEAKSILEKFS